jgi:hypothetical protein
MMRAQKKTVTWTQVRAKVSQLDRALLIDLVRDLYAAHKENRTFLHSRFAMEDDSLEAYKTTIARWMWPDPFSRQSVARQGQTGNLGLQTCGGECSRARRFDGLLLRARSRFLR